MILGLLLKSLREAWPATVFFCMALFAIEAILAYVLPTFIQDFSIPLLQVQFIRTMITALLGTDVGDMLRPDALAAIAWAHPAVLALVWAHAIVLCTRMPAGEIDRGTIDVLLGLPVSRWRVYASELVVLVVTGLGLIGMGLLGNRLGGLFLEDSPRLDLGVLVIITVNLFCLYLAVGGLASLVSTLSAVRGRAVGIVFAILLGSFLLNFLAQFWGPADRLSFLSVLEYYRPLLVLREVSGPSGGGWPLGDIAVLTISAAVLWGAGGVWFARRDIRTV